MVGFIEESYSPIAIFSIPAVTTTFIFLWRRADTSALLTWFVASAVSAAIYLIGSVIFEGMSPLIGVTLAFAFIAQLPVTLSISALMLILRQNRTTGRTPQK